MSSMDPIELARWTRFATKGGIGKCTATTDCIAESTEDLMFLKNDEIVVLLQVGDKEGVYLGYCEGVIGRFRRDHVRFHAKLKKPIMAKRSSPTISISSTGHSVSSSIGIGKSPTPTFTPPSSRLGGSFISPTPITGYPHQNQNASSISSVMQGGPGSRGSTPASPFSMTASSREGKELDPAPIPASNVPVNANATTAATATLPNTSQRHVSLGLGLPMTVQERRMAAFAEEVEEEMRNMGEGRVFSGVSQGSNGSQSQDDVAGHVDQEREPAPAHHGETGASQVPSTEDLLSLERQFDLVEEGWKRRTFLPAGFASPGPGPGEDDESDRKSRPTPLDLDHLDAQINPLRIAKKSPFIPAEDGVLVKGAASREEVEEAETTPLRGPASPPPQTYSPPASSNSFSAPLDTSFSYSTTLQNRLSVASAEGAMEIGLSLLQNLVDGEDSDESGSEYDSEGGFGGGGLDQLAKQGNGLTRNASVRSEGTVDGLRYGSDEDEDEGAKEGATGAEKRSGFDEDEEREDEEEITASSFPMSAFPVPPNTLPARPPTSPTSPTIRHAFPTQDGGMLSPGSPTSPGFHQFHHPHSTSLQHRVRRPSEVPSLAPSSTSVGTQGTNGSWEGAGDIYDDYRYSYRSSRISLSSLAGSSFGRAGGRRMSQASTLGGGIAKDGVEVPPLPERKGSVDEVGAGAGVGASALSDVGMSTREVGAEQVEEEAGPPAEVDSRSTAIRRDSDASVYTQASDRSSLALSAFMSRGPLEGSSHTGTGSFGGALGDGLGDSRGGAGVSLARSSMGGSSVRASTATMSSATSSAFAGNRPPPLNLGRVRRASSVHSTTSFVQTPNQGVIYREGARQEEHQRRAGEKENEQAGEREQERESRGSGQSATSPLLHATWGSPLSSPDLSTAGVGESAQPSGVNGYTPIHGVVPVVNGASLVAGLNTTNDGTGGAGTFGRGIASAMRQMIEDGKKGGGAGASALVEMFTGGDTRSGGYQHSSSADEQGEASMDISITESERREGGLGKQIVVDDDEELPSHVEDSYTTASDSQENTLLLDSPPRGGPGAQTTGSTNHEDGEEDMELDDVPILPATPISAAAPPLPPSTNRSPGSNYPAASTPPPPDFNVTAPSAPPSPGGPQSQQPSHLRPSLRDLREGGTVRVPGTGERRSLFLPHPNAPKTPRDLGGLESPGPMYVRERGTPPSSPNVPSSPDTGMGPGIGGVPIAGQLPGPHFQWPPTLGGYPPYPPPPMMKPSARAVIIQALSRGPQPPGPGGRRLPMPPRGPTIYGRIEGDFALSMGPIPITWSVEPPPTKMRVVAGVGTGVGAPQQGIQGSGPPLQQQQGAIRSASPQQNPPKGPPPNAQGVLRGPLAMPLNSNPARSSPLRAGSVPLPVSTPNHPPGASNPVAKRPSMVSLREGLVDGGGPASRPGVNVRSSLGSSTEEKGDHLSSTSKLIPRANFFPKVGGVGARPRSRSFSGIGAAEPSIKKSESNFGVTAPGEIKKSTSLTGTAVVKGKLIPLRPSPLSLPQNNLTNQPPANQNANPLLRPRTSTPALRAIPPRGNLFEDAPHSPQPPLSPKRRQSNAPVSPRMASFGLTRSASPESIAPGLARISNPPSISTSPPSKPTSPSPPATGPAGPVPGLHLRRLTTSRSAINLCGPVEGRAPSWEEANGFRPPSISSSTSKPIAIPSRKNSMGALSPPPSFLTLSVSGSANSSPASSMYVDSPQSGFGTGLGGGLGGGLGASPTLSMQSRVGGSELGAISEDSANSTKSGGGHVVASASNNSGAGRRGSTDNRSQLVTSPTASIARQNSLRTKLSLPNLRRNRSRQEDVMSMDGANQANDVLLQVQDMEFELVRPSLNQFSAARASEDSGVLGREGALESAGLSVGGSSSFLRTDSPAFSTSSDNRSPTVEGNPSWAVPRSSLGSPPSSLQPYNSPPATSPPAESGNMEAHRNRELKWMALLGSSPPSQARKSKKARKLLLDGVPSSVRYLVWSHLTDGKAKSVPGVYAQLCKRGSVPLTERIDSDVSNGPWFLDDARAQLRSLKEGGGGVVQLLQAYLNMVPDIQYSSGLPRIVGQLLLLAPEEDAFWIFVSIMDTHTRPYFASGTTQMEVDAALFSRALESNDAATAKKLFVEMGILPVSICQPWFSSLFVGCLPDAYLARTWDLFLFDGIPFLIRIGLAIISFVRRQLLESTSEEDVLSLLHRPPSISLPPTPENYLAFALSIKLKDDDIKKQRLKMEAQVKRQIQQQQPRSAGSISLPRS